MEKILVLETRRFIEIDKNIDASALTLFWRIAADTSYFISDALFAKSI